MKTILLPGFSLQNRDWAEEVRDQIGKRVGLEIHYWPHWQTGEAIEGWKEREVERFLNETGKEKVNVIGKSIGTLVAVMALNKNIEIVNKIVLCGVPVYDLRPGDGDNYQVLARLRPGRVMVIQNEKDNHGSFDDVAKMMASISQNILTVSRPREDHHYPYAPDFENFLAG